MRVEVIHTAALEPFERTPKTVAFVDVGDKTILDALDIAFSLTQNGQGNKFGYWRDNPKVEFVGETATWANHSWSSDERSTSVYDHLRIGNELYEIRIGGFNPTTVKAEDQEKYLRIYNQKLADRTSYS